MVDCALKTSSIFHVSITPRVKMPRNKPTRERLPTPLSEDKPEVPKNPFDKSLILIGRTIDFVDFTF